MLEYAAEFQRERHNAHRVKGSRKKGVIGGIPNVVAERDRRPADLHRPCPDLDFEALYAQASPHVAEGRGIGRPAQAHRAFDPLEGKLHLMDVREQAMERMALTDVVLLWQAVNLKEYELPVAAYNWRFALTQQLELFDAAEVGWEEWAEEGVGNETVATVRNLCLAIVADGEVQ
jgi:hypothetical protein